MTVWLLAVDKKCTSYEELKQRNVIAQGWPEVPDLMHLLPPRNEHKFREIINNYVAYFYDGWEDRRDPGKIIWNLFQVKKDDYIIFCEGETVRGFAKLKSIPEYKYQKKYEYAHSISSVFEWKDACETTPKIELKSRGPVGLQRYRGGQNIAGIFSD